MKNKLVSLSVLAAVLAISGCVTTTATMLGGAVASTTGLLEPEQIVVFRRAEQVGMPFREVAILNSTGDSLSTDVSEFHMSMQQKAAKLGANAIILGSMQEPSPGAKFVGALIGTDVDRTSDAIAIVVEGLEAPPAKLKKK